jgi:hypothetical protein
LEPSIIITMLMDSEIVICAAIQGPDGYVVLGHRHTDCIRTMTFMPRYKDKKRPWEGEQGFVTSKNRFVGRLEACRLQIDAGIASVLPLDQAFYGGELYSEDLY